MEQTLGKSRVLRESVMVLFTEQKVDHENRPQIFQDGKITNTATYIVNPQNPSGFQEVKRVDRFGASHNGIPTPHVHENGKVRPAKKEDL